jgi:hypothetical protein
MQDLEQFCYIIKKIKEKIKNDERQRVIINYNNFIITYNKKEKTEVRKKSFLRSYKMVAF